VKNHPEVRGPGSKGTGKSREEDRKKEKRKVHKKRKRGFSLLSRRGKEQALHTGGAGKAMKSAFPEDSARPAWKEGGQPSSG